MSRSVAAEPRKAGTTNTDAEVSAAASSEVPPALDVVAGYAWRLIVLAIVLLFFFVKDGPAIWAWLVRQWPARWGPHIDEAGRRSWTVLGGYLRGTAIIGLVDAILIGIALALIGVPFVLPLSMLTFLGGFLPLIGASVAGIIAALVALVSGGVVDALLVLGVIIVIQQVEGDLLAPYILGKALQLHAVAILLSLTAGAAFAGIVGAFLAVPVAAVGYTVLEYTRSARRHSALSVTELGVGTGTILIRDRPDV